MAKKKKIENPLVEIELAEDKGETIEQVKAKLPFVGLFDYPAEDHGLPGLSSETLQGELKWLRRYYRKFKYKVDLERIKEIKKELELRNEKS